MADEETAIKFAPLPGISRSRIDRAGDSLREFWTGERLRDQQVEEAMEVLVAFRSSFQEPLNKTVMGLRSMVTAEWPELRDRHLPVVQRLKRREQIAKGCILRRLARPRGPGLASDLRLRESASRNATSVVRM